MINPYDVASRLAVSRAVDHSFSEKERFDKMRANTIRAHLGISPKTPDWDWAGFLDTKYQKSLPKGNLLQVAGLSHQISLAYGEPEFLANARTPDHNGIAYKLGPALNRMARLLDLGETARKVAADSFFGYGIFKVGHGCLPASARAATGVEYGPCVWRVGQPQFLYDVSATSWDNVDFVGDIYTLSLSKAQEKYPQHADKFTKLTDSDRLDAPIVMPRRSTFYAAQPKVRFVDLYFPEEQLIGVWALRHDSFGEIAEEPVAVYEYEGHWSGIYQVLTHLYSPDELVPISQAESVKALHYLFNDILHLTSEQARQAKVNPTFQTGSEKDMQRLWAAEDRRPVGITNPQQFGSFVVEGPTQSQMNFLNTTNLLFKSFVPSIDEPQRAPTATQGNLVRQTTNAVIAEARRKFNRVLQLVGYKLADLLIKNDDIMLPNSVPITPGSNVVADATWLPASSEPRTAKVDDLDIAIEPYSTLYRSPEERLAAINASIGQTLQVAQAVAMGAAPINVEKYMEIQAKYGVPELREIYEPADPLAQAKSQDGQQRAQRQGVGEYVRRNISEKTDAGALEENLTQFSDEGGAGQRSE